MKTAQYWFDWFHKTKLSNGKNPTIELIEQVQADAVAAAEQERDALRAKLAEAENARSCLRFELEGMDRMRQSNNAYLIAERDAALAELAALKGACQRLVDVCEGGAPMTWAVRIAEVYQFTKAVLGSSAPAAQSTTTTGTGEDDTQEVAERRWRAHQAIEANATVPPVDEDSWKCPHCGCHETWFDRSISYHADGTEEGMATRCSNCGRPVESADP